MERFLRNIFLIILLLSMLLLLGSGRNANLPVERSEAERAAEHLGAMVPRNDKNEWCAAAAQRPLWLLHVTSANIQGK
jgi:hypothetical protein